MHILIGAGLAIVLLYFWLLGGWFARVLVFLILAVVGFVVGAMMAGGQQPESPIILGLIGAALAWPIASLPTYYWRHQLALLSAPLRQP